MPNNSPEVIRAIVLALIAAAVLIYLFRHVPVLPMNNPVSTPIEV